MSVSYISSEKAIKVIVLLYIEEPDIGENGASGLIAIISYFNGSPELLNCGGVVAENIAVSRDGFYFIPLNRDEVPLGTQIILKQEPIDGLKKYLSNKNFQGIGPKNADSIAQNIGMKVLKYLISAK